MREHLGIQRVRLGQDAAGAGKVAHLAWVDHHHGQPGGGQDVRHRLFIAATGLQDEPAIRLPLHPLAQGGVTGGDIGHPPGRPGRMDGHIQVVPGDIDAEIQIQSGSH